MKATAKLLVIPSAILFIALFVSVVLISVGRVDLVGAQAAPLCSTSVSRGYPISGVFGRCALRGYFTNAEYGGSGTPLFHADAIADCNNNGISDYGEASSRCGLNVDNVNDFITAIKGRARLSDPGYSVSASFIIYTMLGKNGADYQKPPSAFDIAKWEGIVRAHDALGGVKWDENTSFPKDTLNTLYDTTKQDVDFYLSDSAETRYAIRFVDPSTGKVLYTIKKNCGNPIGHLEALPNYEEYTGTADVNCTTVSGRAYDRYRETTQDVNVRIYYALEGDEASQVIATSNNDGNPASPTGYSWTVPTSVKSSTRRTYIKVVILDTGPGLENTVLYENFLDPCLYVPPPTLPVNYDGIANVDCLKVSGWVGSPNYPDITFRVKISIALSPNAPTYDDIYFVDANLSSPSSPTVSGNHGFSWDIPAQYLSTTQGTYVKVDMINVAGVVIANLYNATIDNGAPCIVTPPTNWEYSPATPTSATTSTATNPKPGDVISINAVITNIGTGTGPDFTQTIQHRFETGDNVWSDWVVTTFAQTGLTTGGTVSKNRSITISNEIKDGGRICFKNGVNPWKGQASPNFVIEQSDRKDSEQLCITVFNKRYGIANLSIDPVSGSTIYPGSNISFTFSFKNSGSITKNGTYPNAAHGTAYGISANMSMPSGDDIATLNFDSSTYGTQDIDANESSAVGNFTVDITGGAPGSQICLKLEATPEFGFSDPADSRSSGTVSLEKCFSVGESPYIEVYGANVLAGGNWASGPSFSGSSWCPFYGTRQDAYIKSVRINGVGSVSEFGATAMALSGITNFVTTADEDDSLQFANTGPDTPGAFNTQAECITDYYNYLSHDSADGVQTASGVNLPASSGQYFINGLFSTTAAQTIGSKQIILLVDGDVSIGQNIVYGNYSVADPSDIPFFMLVASGNINISQNVTQLDGVYVSRDGQIDTCSNGASAAGKLKLDSCPQQLVIHGAFMAPDIQFRRTFGGVVRNAADDPKMAAELFEFSPELLVAQPNFITGNFIDLPASQVKDLPPTY